MTRRRWTTRPLTVSICVLFVTASVVTGCAAPWSQESDAVAKQRGPRLVRSIPAVDGALAASTRHVLLEFDRELDTGAQLVVEYGRTDVTAGTPELSSDRRMLETDVDVEDGGTYRVTWRACSARAKTDCGEGQFTFEAEDR